MLWISRLTTLLLLLVPTWARANLPDLCRTPIATVERTTGVPDRLMQAISVMESGRRDQGGPALAWPWTINVEGVGEIFETKQQAVAAVLAHQARGARSIDVGCMQVNLMHHPEAFSSLDEAFDPATNARYAAGFLQRLLAQTGSWPLAVAGYHSLTPDIGGDYAKKVMAIWARPEVGRAAPQLAQAAPPPSAPFASASAFTQASPVAALPPPTRLLATPGSPLPTLVGRGLDSYRALPTRLAISLIPGRSS